MKEIFILEKLLCSSNLHRRISTLVYVTEEV